MESDIFIYGMSHRNRAIHGDIVVVAMLPRIQWRGRSDAIASGTNTDDSNKGRYRKDI